MKLAHGLSALSVLLGPIGSVNADDNINGQATEARQVQTENTIDDELREYFENETESDNAEATRFAQDTGAEATATDAAAPAAGAKPKKKKKKKAGAEGDAAPTTEGSVGHGAQESGLPYKANVDLNLTYSSQSETRKYSDQSFKSSDQTMELDLKYYFVMGRFEIGPALAFISETEKSETADSKDTTKTTGIGFGAGFAVNLGNIHQDSLVPYIGAELLSVSATATSSTEGITSTSKTSTKNTSLGLEGGVKYFMGGHIALKPFVNYSLTMSGEYKTEVTGSDALVASVTGSTLSLGMGLAKYF